MAFEVTIWRHARPMMNIRLRIRAIEWGYENFINAGVATGLYALN